MTNCRIRTVGLLILLCIACIANAQFNRDSSKAVWARSLKKIFKAYVDNSKIGYSFAYNKHDSQLRVAVVMNKYIGQPVVEHIYYYFMNSELIMYRVVAQYPSNRKAKGEVEFYFSNDTLVYKYEKGHLINDYSYLKDKASIVVAIGQKLFQERFIHRKRRKDISIQTSTKF